MPLYTAGALVLRSYKLGETSRIVVFLTRDRGKKRGVAKGARLARSRFTAALEPLTETRVAYFESERRELVGLNYAEVVRSPLMAVPIDPGGPVPDTRSAGASAPAGVEAGSVARADPGEVLGYSSYFAELLDEWAQEADADERLFRLGTSVLEALVAGAPLEPLARYFECWLLRLQGVYPESQVTISPGAAAFLAASRRVPPLDVAAIAADRCVIRELEGVHRTMIARHLEKTLKSERVLRDLRRHA